jgi:hypothetical protein
MAEREVAPMTDPEVALIVRSLTVAHSRLIRRLEGIEDEEWFWEPVPARCRGRRSAGSLSMDGRQAARLTWDDGAVRGASRHARCEDLVSYPVDV